MLLYDLINKCDGRFVEPREEGCGNCKYDNCCPHNCAMCLHYIHTPTAAPQPRKYDCRHMADFYFCKYSYRYASELVYALKRFKDIHKNSILKVMSIGCGPCTELCAVDYLHENGVFTYEKLEFRGIDPLKKVWNYIHQDIKNYLSEGSIEFYYQDILSLIDIVVTKKWMPDLVIFQYSFSDMYKNSSEQEIDKFIIKLSTFINEVADKSVYILANDVNLSTAWKGGREFFDKLGKRLNEPKIFKPWHFDPNHKEKHYEYGEQYNSNDLVFKFSEEIDKRYAPYNSCGSAQALMKRW